MESRISPSSAARVPQLEERECLASSKHIEDTVQRHNTLACQFHLSDYTGLAPGSGQHLPRNETVSSKSLLQQVETGLSPNRSGSTWRTVGSLRREKDLRSVTVMNV